MTNVFDCIRVLSNHPSFQLFQFLVNSLLRQLKLLQWRPGLFAVASLSNPSAREPHKLTISNLWDLLCIAPPGAHPFGQPLFHASQHGWLGKFWIYLLWAIQFLCGRNVKLLILKDESKSSVMS